MKKTELANISRSSLCRGRSLPNVNMELWRKLPQLPTVCPWRIDNMLVLVSPGKVNATLGTQRHDNDEFGEEQLHYLCCR